VVFGAGAIARLGELARELGASRVLVVTDPGVVAAGHAALGESLRKAASESGGGRGVCPTAARG
jgi:alcohol dehydrogenase